MLNWPWKSPEGTGNDYLSQDWQEALSIPLFSPLNDKEQALLIKTAVQLLNQKNITACHGLSLSETMKLRIALIAVLPVLTLGIGWLNDFNEIQIHPSRDSIPSYEPVKNSVGTKEHSEAFHSMEPDAIYLCWPEVQDSFDLCGFNCVIHEIARKLDLRNGGHATGVPPVALREMQVWKSALLAAMDDIQEEIEALGENAASIDAIAAKDPAECFAVLSEYFFSATELFAVRFPELYRQYRLFYRQDPLARLFKTSKVKRKTRENVEG